MSFFRFREYFGIFRSFMGILVFLVVLGYFRVGWLVEMILDTAQDQ